MTKYKRVASQSAVCHICNYTTKTYVKYEVVGEMREHMHTAHKEIMEIYLQKSREIRGEIFALHHQIEVMNAALCSIELYQA